MPPFPTLDGRGLELRLDEDHKDAARGEDGLKGGEYLQDGNERDVHGDDLRGPGEIPPDERAGVLLDHDDARVAAELPVELFRVHVDGIDEAGAAAEQAIRETAGRRPDIGGDLSGRVYAEGVQRLGQLRAGAADEGLCGLDVERLIGAQKRPGLGDALAAARYEPRHEHRPGLLEARREAPLDQQLIGSLFHDVPARAGPQ